MPWCSADGARCCQLQRRQQKQKQPKPIVVSSLSFQSVSGRFVVPHCCSVWSRGSGGKKPECQIKEREKERNWAFVVCIDGCSLLNTAQMWTIALWPQGQSRCWLNWAFAEDDAAVAASLMSSGNRVQLSALLSFLAWSYFIPHLLSLSHCCAHTRMKCVYVFLALAVFLCLVTGH